METNTGEAEQFIRQPLVDNNHDGFDDAGAYASKSMIKSSSELSKFIEVVVSENQQSKEEFLRVFSTYHNQIFNESENSFIEHLYLYHSETVFKFFQHLAIGKLSTQFLESTGTSKSKRNEWSASLWYSMPLVYLVCLALAVSVTFLLGVLAYRDISFALFLFVYITPFTFLFQALALFYYLIKPLAKRLQNKALIYEMYFLEKYYKTFRYIFLYSIIASLLFSIFFLIDYFKTGPWLLGVNFLFFVGEIGVASIMTIACLLNYNDIELSHFYLQYLRKLIAYQKFHYINDKLIDSIRLETKKRYDLMNSSMNIIMLSMAFNIYCVLVVIVIFLYNAASYSYFICSILVLMKEVPYMFLILLKAGKVNELSDHLLDELSSTKWISSNSSSTMTDERTSRVRQSLEEGNSLNRLALLESRYTSLETVQQLDRMSLYIDLSRKPLSHTIFGIQVRTNFVKLQAWLFLISCIITFMKLIISELISM
jgi:hypothetical protein